MVVMFSLLLGFPSVALVGGQLSKRTVVGWAVTMGTLDARWNNTYVASSCTKSGMDRSMDGRATRRSVHGRGCRQGQ